MRILFVSHSFPVPGRPLSNVGGMQRVAVAQCRSLAELPGVEIVPLLLETSWKWTGVRTGPFLVRLIWDLPRLVREHRIDVVLFSSLVTATVTALIGDRIRREGAITAAIPVGRDVTLPNPFYQRLVPRVLAALDVVLPISHATAGTCTERGADPRKVHVVPCGVDPLADASDRRSGRRALKALLAGRGIHLEDSLVLLSVGRHQERKGFHWFVDDVMPRLPRDVTYLLAGAGPMTPRIVEKIAAHRLQSRVHPLGQVSDEDLQVLYSGADIFVMPNIPVEGDIEGFGVVMLEAGAAGLPVVAANLEGIRDVVREDVNGSLIETRDAAGFVQAIERLRNPEALAAASVRARDHVERQFGWRTVAEEYVRILSTRTRRSTPEQPHTPSEKG